MEPTLTLRDVGKRFDDHVSVNLLRLSVPPGTAYGILGPNGAGKSTTPGMTMNTIPPCGRRGKELPPDLAPPSGSTHIVDGAIRCLGVLGGLGGPVLSGGIVSRMCPAEGGWLE